MTTTTAEPTGLVLDMPDLEYHARPELSSTGARRLLDSPARFKWEQAHRVESRAFDVGHAVHAKVLGVGLTAVTYPDEHLTPSGNPSTKAATVAWEAEQRANGLVPIARADMARVEAMAEAVLAHGAARRIFEEPGDAEVSAFATDPDTSVKVRARADRLNTDRLVDLKTTAGSASVSGFGRDAAKHGYPIQEAHYADTFEWVTGQRLHMTFVVVEKRAPHLVAVHQFDEITRITARDLAARARALFAECSAADTWPGYGDDVLTTQMPAWWFDLADDDMEEMVI